MTSTETLEQALARLRAQQLQKFASDPFLGYDSIEDAIADSNYSSQAEALARLFSGKNIFLSGPAGSGKTFLIDRFKEWLDAEYEGRVNIAITASTGIAAQLLGGRTIHSWSGIGINNEKFVQPSKMEWARRSAIESVDVLVIDEISMLPAYLFTRLDALLKYIRKSRKPFGGVQLVVMGDFMQLPPVSKKGERTKDGELLDAGFCIRTDAWREAGFRALYLDKVRRAKDPKLKEVLAKISTDKVDDSTRSMIESRLGAPRDPNKKYMTLFTTNKNVDRYNDERLAENPNPEKRFYPRGEGNPKFWTQIKKSHGIPEVCRLKLDATVMLTANLPDGPSNGSIGKVLTISNEGCVVQFNDGQITFIEPRSYDHTEKTLVGTQTRKGKEVEVYSEEVVSSVLALPLKLGYAISVHKSQGQTFTAVEVDLSYVFSPGLGYVALSRVSSLDDLIITSSRIHEATYEVDKESLRYSRATKKAALARRKEMLKNLEKARQIQEELATSATTTSPEATSAVETGVAANEDQSGQTLDEALADMNSEAPLTNIEVTEIEEEAPPAEDWAVPVDFVSYEQFLTNPYVRSTVWEKRIDDRNIRLAARRKYAHNG